MFKALIEEIQQNKIEIPQAVFRAKNIIHKLPSNGLTEWLDKEIKGYDANDGTLPAYRKIRCQIWITHGYPNGSTDTRFPALGNPAALELYKAIQHHIINWTLFEVWRQSKFGTNRTLLTTQEAQRLSAGDRYIQMVSGGYKEYETGQLQHILSSSRQKLVDVLVEINEAIPNLDQEFANSTEIAEIINNLVENSLSLNPISNSLG